MTVLITLTTIGADAGPFDLYSSVDGFSSAFDFGIPAASLIAGYAASFVPDYTTVVRVKSTGELCTNYVDIPVLQPLDFTITYSCDGTDATLESTLYQGGSLTYFTGTTYFTSEALALANTSWIEATSFSVPIGTTPGTYWLVIKDSVGNIKTKSIDVDCTTTTTTTTPLPNYGIKRCGDLTPFVVAATYPFSTYDVIQFQVGAPGSGTVYCGEVGGIVSGPPDAEIYSPVVYSCGDIVHCS